MLKLKKRCWVCASVENADGNCTNPDCPRYVKPTETTETTETTKNK